MKNNGRIGQRLLLFSLAALIPPMTAFPAQFGTQLVRFSVINLLFELVFYGVVIYAFQRRGGLLQLLPGTAVCLVYRLGMGLVLGLMMTIAYGINLRIATMMGAISYLPGVLFLIAVTPFIMLPVAQLFYRNWDRPRREPARQPKSTATAAEEESTPAAAMPTPRPVKRSSAPRTMPKAARPAARETAASTGATEIDGFDRAVRYIAEHGSVYMAAVVDNEGLLLANYVRGQVDPEVWAPLALVFFQQNEQVLQRGNLDAPERLDLVLRDKRVKIARDADFSLMVIGEREADDVLGIRVKQGMEMVRKHMSERYSHMLDPNAERIHVSSTQ
jgi:predicted regulator of Ras-like GTPase activity (Roadblock/LC7/MglB family)